MGLGWDQDTAVATVGAAVLIAAMAGVFLYERSQFGEYDVSWGTVQAGSATETGTLEAGASESYTFTVDADRLSHIDVHLAWSDDSGAPDTFEVDVQGPGAHTGTAEGASGSLEVEVPIRDAPGFSTAAGRSLEEAREQVDETAVWTNGTGEWTVTVTLVDAPGEQVAGQEAMADGSQGYELTFVHARWEPSLTPV